MKWRLEGVPQSVIMEFVVDGQPVVPDADSIHLTAWNHNAVKVLEEDYTPLVGESPTQIDFALSGMLNTLPSEAMFENRFLRADFKYNSKPYFVKDSYRLHRMIPMTAEPENVRSLVAADFDELTDDEADVVSSYIELATSYGTDFTNALVKTNSVAIAANDAIALQAAIKLCPSMQSRLLKSEKLDNSGKQRADIDFVKLEADLIGRLTDALAIVFADAGVLQEAFVPHTIFLVATQTDRITNTSS